MKVEERDGQVRFGTPTLFPIDRSDRVAIWLRDANRAERRAFTGLRWYPIDPRWRIPGRFVPNPDGDRKVPIANVLGEEVQMLNPGTVAFELDGRVYRFQTLYETDERRDLWILFRDATSQTETYPAGRYLHVDLPVDGRVVVDFNKADNPPCAIPEYATCRSRLPATAFPSPSAQENNVRTDLCD